MTDNAHLVLECSGRDGKCKSTVWRIVEGSLGYQAYVECKLCRARYAVTIRLLGGERS